MTILIHFHQIRFRDFKTYYTFYVQDHLRGALPSLVSYNRFDELMPSVLVPLCASLQANLGTCTGISFIDSTALAVCHNRRIYAHRVFQNLAARDKTSVGWFYGFKLHIIINDAGEIVAWRLTPENVDDRVPVPALTRDLSGKLFGDKGYISGPLASRLREAGVHLITRRKANMRTCPLPLEDAHLLHKRGLIESVVDQLKNVCQIQHTRHRSSGGFLANLFAGLIAYSHYPTKPSLHRRAPTLVIPN